MVMRCASDFVQIDGEFPRHTQQCYGCCDVLEWVVAIAMTGLADAAGKADPAPHRKPSQLKKSSSTGAC
jgi:hypothetical protein